MRERVPITAMILAGGKSSRMGKDKALLNWGGKTLLENLTDLVVPLFNETLVIVKERTRYHRLNLGEAKIYEDLIEDRGPLAGIYTGLSYSMNEASCVFTCDMPLLDDSVIVNLVDAWDENFDVTCLKDSSGNNQPFPGIYQRSDRFAIRALLERREGSVKGYLRLARVNAIPLPKEKVEALTNMNTIEDYDRVLRPKDEWTKG